MTPTEALDIIAHVRSLWPRCDWEEATIGVFTRAILPLNAAASVAALDKYRAEFAGAFIDVAKAIDAVKHGQPRRGWTGTDLPGYWKTVALKLGMKDARPQDVIVAYWRRFEDCWGREPVWRGVVADLRSVCGLDLDQAAYIADDRIGPVPGLRESIDADELFAKESAMRGPGWMREELNRRRGGGAA